MNDSPAPALPPPGVAAESVSPSLRTAGEACGPTGAAFEVKFLLDPELARRTEDRLMRDLLPDPHSDPTLGGMYAISSLACDSPAYGVFFRDPVMNNCKYRVRRYGASSKLYLERKCTRQRRVTKLRSEASLADLTSVATGRADHISHAWFVRDVNSLGLAPVCRVRYLRRALFGTCPDGAVRITFDRNIRGCLARTWSLDSDGPERVLLDNFVVCEFKFQDAMPALLKEVLADLRLEPTGFSKYRACVRAFAAELGVDLSADPAPHPYAANARQSAESGRA